MEYEELIILQLKKEKCYRRHPVSDRPASPARNRQPRPSPSRGNLLGNSGKYITLETSKSNGILKVCFSGAGNSRMQELCDLRSLEFAGMLSSGNSVRRRCGVTNVQKPGISTVGGPDFGNLPIRESNEDSVRNSGAEIRANLRRSEGHFGSLFEI
jgi:hypothetical protein